METYWDTQTQISMHANWDTHSDSEWSDSHLNDSIKDPSTVHMMKVSDDCKHFLAEQNL